MCIESKLLLFGWLYDSFEQWRILYKCFEPTINGRFFFLFSTCHEMYNVMYVWEPNCNMAKFCVVLSSNCTKYPEHGFVRMLQSAFSTLFIFVLFRRANKHFQLHKIHVATIRKSSVFANINTVSIISTKVFRLFYSVFFLKGNWQRFNSVYFNVFEWA